MNGIIEYNAGAYDQTSTYENSSMWTWMAKAPTGISGLCPIAEIVGKAIDIEIVGKAIDIEMKAVCD